MTKCGSNWCKREAAPHKSRCETCLGYSRRWSHANPEKTRAICKSYRDTLRAKVLRKLGNKCVVCGFDDPRALQIDHIEGGGRLEYMHASSYQGYLRMVFEDTTGKYQLLCANHNWIKRYEMKEHKRKRGGKTQ